VEIVQRDRNHPAIIGWCPFNETPVEAGALQNQVLELTRAIDPSAPVIDTSGWSHSYPHPEIMDAHDYDQNPATFRARWQEYFAPSAAAAAVRRRASRRAPS
jgi:beta-galactosidase/beta-glucuronidase